MKIIKNILLALKNKWEEFVRDFWMFHPVIAFGLFLRPIVEISTEKYSTGEAIGIAISLFGLNLFFWLMWVYKKHLIKKEEERIKRNKEKWKSFEKTTEEDI